MQPMISLKGLYDHVYEQEAKRNNSEDVFGEKKNYIHGSGLDGNSNDGRNYMKKVNAIIEAAGVDEAQGIYLFGSFDTEKRWKNIYLGMATDGRLKSRLCEQLNDARLVFWRAVMTEEEVLRRVNITYKGKYQQYAKNHLLKVGVSHIAWFSADDLSVEGDIRKIEADLIETLNPVANINRPKPEQDVFDQTIKLLKRIRKVVHESRNYYHFGIV